MFDHGDRSFLWDAAALSAVGAGGFASYRNSGAAFKSALGSSGMSDIPGRVAGYASDYSRVRSATTGAAALDAESAIYALRGMGDSNAVRQDVAQSMYQSLLKTGRATGEGAYTAFRQVRDAGTVDEAYLLASKNINDFAGDPNLFYSNMREMGIETSSHNPMFTEGVSSSGNFDIRRKSQNLSKVSPGLRNAALGVRGRFTAAAGSSVSIKDRGIYMMDNVPFYGMDVAGTSVNVPLANTPYTYGGENLTTKYTARQAYDKSGNIMNFTEKYVSDMEGVLQGQQTNRAAKNAIQGHHLSLMEQIADRDSQSRAQLLYSQPSRFSVAGTEASNRLSMRQAVFTGGPMTEQLREEMVDSTMRAGKGMWPIGSPGPVSKGTFFTSNVSEDLYGSIGNLFPIERRPTVSVRSGFGASAAAKINAPAYGGAFGKHFSRLDRKMQGSAYKDIMYGGLNASDAGAYSSPQMLTYYAKGDGDNFAVPELGKIMSPEDAIVNPKSAYMMQTERTTSKVIDLREGMSINPEIQKALAGQEVGYETTFTGAQRTGNFIGTEANTGKAFMREAKYGTSEIEGVRLLADRKAEVFMRETYNLTEGGNPLKIFSETEKALARTMSEENFAEHLRVSRGGSAGQIVGQEIEQLAYGKMIARNPMALITQQTEAMGMIVGQRLGAGPVSEEALPFAMNFMKDPSRGLAMDLAVKNYGAEEALYQIQRNAVVLANKMDFHQKEMQVTFGLMEEGTLSRLVKEGHLRKGQAGAIEASRGVLGLSKSFVGDLSWEGGAGRLASIEQSGLRLLAMKGEGGQRLAAELASRIEGKGYLPAMTMMEGSVLGQEEVLTTAERMRGKIPTDKRLLGELGAEELVQEEGRFVKLGRSMKSGGGTNRLYIPGSSEIDDLIRPTLVGGRDTVNPPLLSSLEELRYSLSSDAGDEAVEAAYLGLRKQTIIETSKQAVGRGRIVGSSFLTPTRQVEGASRSFGISRSKGLSMMDDLIGRSNDDAAIQFLEEQKRSFLNNEEILGVVARHPATGPESMQVTRFRMDASLAEEMATSPYATGSVTFGKVTKPVDVSQAVGMKLDYDRDTISLSLISDKGTYNKFASEEARGMQKGYENYLFRHYAMKEAVVPGMSNLKMSQSDIIKKGARDLTAAATYTPEVNLAFQKLKIGMAYNSPEEYGSLAETLFNLEEAAISGKQGSLESSLYSELSGSLESKDAARMENALTGIFGEARTISGDINAFGKTTTQSFDWNPKQTASKLMSIAESTSEEALMAHMTARAAGRRGSVPSGLKDLVAMRNARLSGSIDAAQTSMEAGRKGIGKALNTASRRATKTATKARGMVGALKAHGGKLGLGVAAAAGIMLMAPSGSGSIGPIEGPQGGRQFRDGDLGVADGVRHAPRPPNITSPVIHDISGIQTASRANIRMTLDDYENAPNLWSNLSNLGSGGNVNVRTTDDREALDPRRLAGKIHERL